MRTTPAALCAVLLCAWPLHADRFAQELSDHDFASLREAEIELADFIFPALEEGRTLNLREAVRGQKLVLLTYFAAWCHNSNFDVQTVRSLHEKYRKKGLAVIGVCEYSSRDELRDFVSRHKTEYPVCLESDDQLRDRTVTTHYKMRMQAGDKDRKWGTPLTLLFRAEALNASKDAHNSAAPTISARVVAGEMNKAEVEDFIRQQLSDKQK
ncbi:MAG TPA: TlpA disulfide reductase family protein [Blastocatellia bacterium]|nr:TlpA disulfide reductase family protein [Blastocatellia bacterium]